MRLIVHLTEYESEGGNSVSMSLELEDGTSHQELTCKFHELLSLVYGYSVGDNYAHPNIED
jgi:hypothetical protein